MRLPDARQMIDAEAHLDKLRALSPVDRSAYLAALPDSDLRAFLTKILRLPPMIRLSPDQQLRLPLLLRKLKSLEPEHQEADLFKIEAADPELAMFLRGALGMPVSLLGLSPGDVIEGYEIGRLVNAGSFGQVWRARELDTVRPVALKFLRTSLLLEDLNLAPVCIERFREEIRRLAGFRHQYIVRLLRVGEIPLGWGGITVPYGVMEYEESDPIHPSPYLPDRDKRLRCFLQVCDAVASSHHRGLVHLDLNPNNVRVRSTGEAVVIDFGIAAQLDATRPYSAAHLGAGTIPYMAPEQLDPSFGAIGRATDVHALGVILFQMLSPDQLPYELQEHPDPEARREGLIRAIVDPKRVDLRICRPEISPQLAEIVARAVAFRPPDRFSDAGEFHAALTVWQQTSTNQKPSEDASVGGGLRIGHNFNFSGATIGSINAPTIIHRAP